MTGHGVIDSDAIIGLGGTVRAEGGVLTVDGGLVGSASYEVMNGAQLNLDLGTCSIFGFACPFTRVVSAEGELENNDFLVRSGDAPSQFTLIGASTNPFIETLTNTRVELDGAMSTVVGVSTTLGQRSLQQTLETLDNAEFVVSGGQQFASANAGMNVALTNGSILEVAGTDSAFSGAQLDADTVSTIAMRGGTVDVGGISIGDDAVVNGYGVITDAVITNRNLVQADDGTLEIRDSIVNQQLGAGSRWLEATEVAIDSPDPASILRLTNTQVNGGVVRVLPRALLTGNGTFNDTFVVNFGTFLVGDVSGGNSATTLVETGLFNLTTGDVFVSNATLALNGADSDVQNFGNARIEVFSAAADTHVSMIDIQGGSIEGGELALVTEGVNDTRPATVSILGGFGSIKDVNLIVDEFSLVDASFAGQVLEFDIGAGRIDNAGTMLASSGGILRLLNGVMTGAGDVIADTGSVVEIENMDFRGANLATRGDGIIRDIGTSTFSNLTNDGVFEISGTGDVTLAGNVENVDDSQSRIAIRSGGVLQLADGGVTPDGEPVPFAMNGGTLLVEAGGTVVGNGHVLSARGVVVTGNGQIRADVFLDGNDETGDTGTLAPGASPGMLDFVGDVTFGTLNELEIEIGGTTRTTEHDWINVSGTLALGGMLEVVLIDLGGGVFNPALGDTFDIIDAAVIDGMFAVDGILLPGLDPGLLWDLSNLAIDGTLTVAAVPLPPAVWTFLAALLGLSRIARRRCWGPLLGSSLQLTILRGSGGRCAPLSIEDLTPSGTL